MRAAARSACRVQELARRTPTEPRMLSRRPPDRPPPAASSSAARAVYAGRMADQEQRAPTGQIHGRSSESRPGDPCLQAWGGMAPAPFRCCLRVADEKPITRDTASNAPQRWRQREAEAARLGT